MQISYVNYLTVFEINLSNGEQDSTVIVFYDSINNRIIPIGQMNSETKSQIEEYLNNNRDDNINMNLNIPDYIQNNIKNIQDGNLEFFGITKNLKNYQETNKEDENE